MKKNDTLTLEITDITNLGFGVGRADGIVVFVADTVPGDIIRAKIIKVASSYLVGRAEEFLARSDKRDPSRCGVSGCRACSYRELSYAEEIKLKEDTVKQEFIKAGLPELKINPLIPSPLVSEYRNKAQYPVSATKDGKIKIGFYSPKTHNVSEAADCPLTPPVFTKILNTVRSFLERERMSVYDEESHSGLVRHIYLRRSQALGEVLLCIVINGSSFPCSDKLVKEITTSHPEVCGIVLNTNEKKTNVILGDRYKTLWGKDYICDTLAGVKLKISAPAFYQINHGTAELIYKKARELAALKDSDTLLDLFCGTGSIGLSMAKDAKELIGIEIVKEAVECAKFNAEENGIKNAAFFTGDASDCEKLLDEAKRSLGQEIKPDVIVLDPPRAGCSEELLNYIATLSPKRIVYVSCNPSTLARDIKIMKELNYTAGNVHLYDMFPMTGHVESVVCLTRR